MLVPFRILDVFCEAPFTGNQLCVVPKPLDLQTPTMQMLAREIGFSETTFVTSLDDDRYAMRIFTPGQELPFAGHPTLGTAFLLVAEGRVRSPVTQVVGAGEIIVDVDASHGHGRMRQLAPEFGPELEDRETVARSAGLEVGDLHPHRPVRTVSTGLPHTMVPVRDLATLRRAQRNGPLVGEVVRAAASESLYLFAEDDRGGIAARMFDWEHGVGEDPATGSAAGPLGAYLADLGVAGMPGSMIVRQGEQVGRPSVLEVEVRGEDEAWAVFVGGRVEVVGQGAFRI